MIHSDHAHQSDHSDEAEPDDFYFPAKDEIALVTVGVDVGSSTTHLGFSRVVLRRLGQQLSSRFVVAERTLLFQSAVHLTPYRADYTIDGEAIEQLIFRSFREAGLAPADVDTGAVILTGEAVKRDNAREIASLFAGEVGRFVCATAGPYLEAVLTAHGSGAVERSRGRSQELLLVDIGGGTTKFALISSGTIVRAWHLEIGARLIAVDDRDVLMRAEPAGIAAAGEIGLEIVPGMTVTRSSRSSIGRWMAERIYDEIVAVEDVDAIVIAGGVAEYVFGREDRDFGDLGAFIADRVLELAATAQQTLIDTGEGIRATVVGLAQYTIQASGSTILLAGDDVLPLRDVYVVSLDLHADQSVTQLRTAVEMAIQKIGHPEHAQLALAVGWDGSLDYRSLKALAEAILGGAANRALSGPLVLIFERDIGRLVASIIRDELGHPGSIVSIDGITVGELDRIDLGAVVQPAGVVPVVVKSLVFPGEETGS